MRFADGLGSGDLSKLAGDGFQGCGCAGPAERGPADERHGVATERLNTTKQTHHALTSVQCAYRYDRGQLCTGGVVWASGVRAYAIPTKCPHYGCPLSSRQAQIVIMV